MTSLKVLFIAKENDAYAEKAMAFLSSLYPSAISVTGMRGSELPAAIANWKGDLLISYLSPWIIPAEVLENAQLASINFHPGSPAYPGIGCTNFALYNNEKQFGITCHHMLPKVDTGNIIAVSYFPIEQNDSVWTLTQRCYSAISELFVKVISELHESGKFAVSPEKWQRVAYRRVELNALCKITNDMSEEEVNRRIRATTFPNMPGAYIELYGHKFNYTA